MVLCAENNDAARDDNMVMVATTGNNISMRGITVVTLFRIYIVRGELDLFVCVCAICCAYPISRCCPCTLFAHWVVRFRFVKFLFFREGYCCACISAILMCVGSLISIICGHFILILIEFIMYENCLDACSLPATIVIYSVSQSVLFADTDIY